MSAVCVKRLPSAQISVAIGASRAYDDGTSRQRESVHMRFEDLGGRFVISSALASSKHAPQSDVQLLGNGSLPDAVAASLAEISLSIVRESRGPMRLWEFARRLEQRLGMPRMATGDLCDAVKAALEQANDPRVAVIATSMPGVGYVYDARDPDAKPVRSSR